MTTNTTGQHGNVQNAYVILAEDDVDEDGDIDEDVVTVITHLAAMTTQSQLTAATVAEGVAAITAAINQLLANQTAMMQMMAYANTTRANKCPQTRIVGGGRQSNTQVRWHQHLCPLTNSTFPTSSRAVKAAAEGGQAEAMEEQDT